MKIAVVGASGKAGSEITAELARRGHQVTAIARHPETLAPNPLVTPVVGDATDSATLAKLLAGHDAVVSAIHFTDVDAPTLVGAVHASGVRRYLVVGGAGSLEVAPGLLRVDAPDFPKE